MPTAGRHFVLALLLGALLTGPPLAADGAPFGSGHASFDAGGNNTDTGRAVVVQPDGRIVMAGTIATSSVSWTLALCRFWPNGVLDSSFGASGYAINPFGLGTNHGAAALRRLADGRLLVAGTLDYGNGDQDFYVGRLLENGSADTAFGGLGDGVAPVAFDLGADHTDTLAAMDLDRSNRILLAGSVDVGVTDLQIGLARLTPEGQLDFGFGGGGLATVAIALDGPDLGLAVAAHPAGGLVVAGASWNTSQGGHFDRSLARVLADGSLDLSFGAAGTVQLGTASGGTNNDFAWAVRVWPDGEVVIGGDLATGSNEWKFTLDRLSANGTYLGGTFGPFCTLGFPPCPVHPQDSIRALVLQGDGKIVAAGFALGPNGDSDFAIGRFHRDLTIDPSFGTSGRQLFDFGYGIGAGNDNGTALALDQDGRLVVAGSIEWNGLDTDFGWVRFDSSYIFVDGFETLIPFAPWSSLNP